MPVTEDFSGVKATFDKPSGYTVGDTLKVTIAGQGVATTTHLYDLHQTLTDPATGVVGTIDVPAAPFVSVDQDSVVIKSASDVLGHVWSVSADGLSVSAPLTVASKVDVLTIVLFDPKSALTSPLTVSVPTIAPFVPPGPVVPIPGATLAWDEPFTDTKAWNVQDGTTRSNEQSITKASNVSVSGGELVLARHKLSSAALVTKKPRELTAAVQDHDALYAKASDEPHGRARIALGATIYTYSSAYIDSIGKIARSVKPGQFLEWEARFGLAAGKSAGIWPGFLWLRAQNGTVEIDPGEDWGTVSTKAGTADDPAGRYLATYWPATDGSKPKVAGFMAAKGENLDLTQWIKMGIRVDLDGSVTIYRGGVPYRPVNGAWPTTPTLPAATNTGLKLAAGDYYNIRINVQIGNSYYGSPDANTDWSQTSGIRNLRCWNLAKAS